MPAQNSGGGGASGGDIKAGGAYYELQLRDKMAAQLAKAQGAVKGFAETAKKHMAPLGGALGQIFNVAATGGAIGIGIGLVQKGIEFLNERAAQAEKEREEAQKRAQAEMAETKKRIEETVASMRGLTAETEKWSATIVAPADRLLDLTTRIKAAFAERDAVGARAEGDGREDAIKRAKVEELGRLAMELDARRRKILDPFKDDAFVRKLNELKEAMKDVKEEAGEHAKAMAALFRAAAAPKDPAVLKKMGEELDAARFKDWEVAVKAELDSIDEGIRKATRSLEDFVDAKKLAAAQSMMTEGEKAIDNARRGGADAGVLADMEGQIRLLESNMGGGLAGLGIAAALSQAVKMGAATNASVRGGFVAPGAIAAQMFGGAGGKVEKLLDKIAEGKGGLAREIGRAILVGLIPK